MAIPFDKITIHAKNALLTSLGNFAMNAPQDLFESALQARKNAYATYSNFSVGSALRADDGAIFSGCNVENAAYGLTVCAEANAICQLIVSGRRKIKEILVVASNDFCPPCGSCRQRIYEFATPETVIHLCCLDGSSKSMTMQELLPHPFTISL